MSELICDDRIDEMKLSKDIKDMTDEEFAAFAKNVKITKHPKQGAFLLQKCVYKKYRKI